MKLKNLLSTLAIELVVLSAIIKKLSTPKRRFQTRWFQPIW